MTKYKNLYRNLKKNYFILKGGAIDESIVDYNFEETAKEVIADLLLADKELDDDDRKDQKMVHYLDLGFRFQNLDEIKPLSKMILYHLKKYRTKNIQIEYINNEMNPFNWFAASKIATPTS